MPFPCMNWDAAYGMPTASSGLICIVASLPLQVLGCSV